MQYFTKNTFQFLKDIAQNNNREWFGENKPRYDEAKKEAIAVAEALMERIMLFDESLRDGEVPYLFRIYRDARYSKGIPYKTHLGILFLKGGRPMMCDRAGYYLHIEPGNSFLGGGAHRPTSKWLGGIREEIAEQPEKLKEIITDPKFQQYYSLEGEKLKTAPRGFPKDHPQIELLRHKSFFAWHPLSDKQVMSGDIVDDLTKAFEAIYPLNAWLNYCGGKVD